MNAKAPLPVGTKIVAVRNVGPVRAGAHGIITTGTVVVPTLFWSRSMYLCTFMGNLKLAMWPKEIDGYDHGYTLEELQNPNALDATQKSPLGARNRSGLGLA